MLIQIGLALGLIVFKIAHEYKLSLFYSPGKGMSARSAMIFFDISLQERLRNATPEQLGH